MGAGPNKRSLSAALSKAKLKAKWYALQHGVKCDARVIRASNGEAAIVYATQMQGKIRTTLTLNPPNSAITDVMKQ